MAERTTKISIGIIVEQAMTRRATGDLRAAWKDLARVTAEGNQATIASQSATFSRLLTIETDHYRKLGEMRRSDARDAQQIDAARLRACADIEAKTRDARRKMVMTPGAGDGGVMNEAQMRAEIDRLRQVRDQMARQSLAIAEQERERVAKAVQSAVRAADQKIAADRRRAAEAVRTGERVEKAWDDETKKANEHFKKVIAAYKEAVAETSKGEPGIGGGKAKGGAAVAGGPISAGDILNAVAISAVYSQVKEQISAAIEQVSKFDDAVNESDAAFGQYTGYVKTWAKTTTQSFGLSETAALAAAAKIGNALTEMGLTGETAAAMSPKIVQLAADLGSFEHIGTDKALNAVTMGLEGNLKGLKNLGIVITTQQMQREAFKQGLISSTKDALEPATRAQVLYTLMLQRGEKASGDFAKRQDDVRNAQERADAALQDAQKRLGEAVKGPYTDFLNVLTGIFQHFKDGPSDIEKFAGAILATVGTGGALTLMAAKIAQIVKGIGGMSAILTPGGLSVGAGLSGVGGVASLAGGTVLALPAVVAGLGITGIAQQNADAAEVAIRNENLPAYIAAGGQRDELKDTNQRYRDRIAYLKSPAADKEAHEAGGAFATSEGIQQRQDANKAEAARLADAIADNEQKIAVLNQIYDRSLAEVKAATKKANVRGHLHDADLNNPHITKQKQPPSDADLARAAAEAQKGEEDAAAAVETMLRAKKDDLQKNLTIIEEQYKAGKGSDSLLDIITKAAIRLRDLELAEAKAVYDRQIARDPKHHKDADAQLAASTRTAQDALHRYRADELPKLTEERDRTIDAATMKLLDARLKDYSKDDTAAQRAHVLSDVDAMRKRLHTANAQEEARGKVSEARKKVEGEILESDEKYREIIEQNRRFTAELTEKRQQAGLDLLNAELSETHDLKQRLALRGQIRDAEIVQAGNVRDAAIAAINAEADATAKKQNNKLTKEQEAGFQTRRDIALQEENNADTQAHTGFTKGTEQDTRDDQGRQARELRERIDFAKTPEEKANLAGQAGALELTAAGPMSDAQRQTMIERQNREMNGYLVDGHFDRVGTSLLTAARTGDKDALSTAFTQAATGRQYASDNSQTAELIAREVKMLLDGAELPGSKLLDGDNKQMVRDRLLNLEGIANRLGDVDLVLKIDADVKRLDEKLLTSSQKAAIEFRGAIIGSVGSGVEAYTNTMLQVFAHQGLGRRDRYGRGQSGRGMMHQATNGFLLQQAATVQHQLTQGLGRLATDNLHDLFKPQTDAKGRVIGPSAMSRVLSDFKSGHIGKDLEDSARKAAAFLKAGGKGGGQELLQGALLAYDALTLTGARGKKHQKHGIIGALAGGIIGSFLPGGWKMGAEVGSAIGGSFAVGSLEIPRDMIAQVHRGEMIVKESDASDVRAGRAVLGNPGVGFGGEVHNHYHTHTGPIMQVGTIHDRVDADRVKDLVTGFFENGSIR